MDGARRAPRVSHIRALLGVWLCSLMGHCLVAAAILVSWQKLDTRQQAEGEDVRRRFSFDNYLGMSLFALLGEGFWWVLIFAFVLAPRIPVCMCPMETKPPTGWGCCGQLPVPWPIQAYPSLFMVLLGMSLLVSLVGIILGRTRRTGVGSDLVYGLELCPFLMLVFLGVVACIVFSLGFTAWWVR